MTDHTLLKKQKVVFEYLWNEFPDQYDNVTKDKAFDEFLYEDPCDIGLAYTTDEETTTHNIQATADLIHNTIRIEVDDELVDVQKYEDSEAFIDFCKNELTFDSVTNGNQKVCDALEDLIEER